MDKNLIAIFIHQFLTKTYLSGFMFCFGWLSLQSQVGVLDERLPAFNGQLAVPPRQDSQ